MKLSVIMPVVSLLTAGNDFSKLAVAIGTNAKGDPLLLKYGAFMQSIVDFLIMGFAASYNPRGWDVTEFIHYPGKDAVEPASPGTPFKV